MNSISNFNPSQIKINSTKQMQAAKNTPLQAESKKMPNTKALIGAACLSAVVVGGLLLKGQLSKAQKLAGQIDFKNAQSLDEAIDFGMKTFGIKEYKGFEAKDLDVVNWINEGLLKVNEKSKGQAKMPEVVQYLDTISKATQGGIKKTAGGSMDQDGVLTLTKDAVELIKGRVRDYIQKFEINPQKQAKLLNQLDNSINYKDWKKAYIEYLDFIPEFKQKVFNQINTSEFNEIYHEMGHWQHFNNVDKYLVTTLSTPWEKINSGIYKLHQDTKSLYELFLNSQNVTKGLTDYAKVTPAEFVAECYSFMCDGVKLPDDVLQLYQKLGGVMI